jgi:pSer/pThr/pTyr-binding forkhead associated (FHA) protein
MKVELLVVQGRPAGKSLVFPQGEYYFGRGAECHIQSNSAWVSRQHCLLRVTSDAAYLRDLGSRNGTLVNGLLVDRERLLDDGDQIQVGPLVFEVHLEAQTTADHPAPPMRDQAGAGTDFSSTEGSTTEAPAARDQGITRSLSHRTGL